MANTFDAVIIGAGIVGSSAAFQLAKRGLKVAVFEKNYIGSGGTEKSSAVIRQHYSNELTAKMALHSVRVFENFDDAVGGDVGFTKTGFLALASAADQAGLEANVKMQQSIGIDTRIISLAELRDIMPSLNVDDLSVAAYEPDGGYADPYSTVNAYANAAKRHGAKFFLGSEITDIRFQGDKILGVNTRTDKYDTPMVLNSAGAWGARVAKLAGVTLPINACRVQVSFFKHASAAIATHPVVVDFINATYFRQETGNLTLSGVIDPAEAEAVVDPDNFKTALDSDFVLDIGEQLLKRFPPIEKSASAGGYASIYAITPDWHPVVDELIPNSGFFVASGYSGHGFKLGPATGVMIADMMLAESDPLFDRRLFRANRYAENDPVVGQYDYSIAG